MTEPISYLPIGFVENSVTELLHPGSIRALESRLVQGLFFAGEVLDLDGPCGGYNLQWAFSSGFLAGKSAGENRWGE